MPNSRFNTMISQHCLNFRSLFVDLSERLFGAEEQIERENIEKNEAEDSSSAKSLKPFHPGEFGNHRELVSTMFLRPFTPDRFELASGFILGADDDDRRSSDGCLVYKPAQCDILAIERDLAPFCGHRELGQFYPLEATSAVGEVKSQLTQSSLKKVLAQISKQTTAIRKRRGPRLGEDAVWSFRSEIWSDEDDLLLPASKEGFCSPLIFLICRSFAVGEASGTLPLWRRVKNKIVQYADETNNETTPDAILSITDGLLIRRCKHEKEEYQCISPGKGSTTHLKKFLSIYFSHLARWQTQRFSFQRYFQICEQDMVFHDSELSDV